MEQKSSVATKNFWNNPAAIICAVLVVFFGAQLAAALFVTPLLQLLPSKNVQLLAYIACNLVCTILLLTTAHRVLKFSWKAIGIAKPTTKSMLLVIPAFIGYFLLSALLTFLASRFIPGFNLEQAQDVGFSNLASRTDLLAGFISLVILTPIFEETIFRGLLFKGLRRKYSFWIAAVASSLLFAVAHMQWNVAIDTFALGLILCYLVEKSGSIVPSILLHALKNCLAFLLLFVIN